MAFSADKTKVSQLIDINRRGLRIHLNSLK
jgi:hypothetical protein